MVAVGLVAGEEKDGPTSGDTVPTRLTPSRLQQTTTEGGGKRNTRSCASSTRLLADQGHRGWRPDRSNSQSPRQRSKVQHPSSQRGAKAAR